MEILVFGKFFFSFQVSPPEALVLSIPALVPGSSGAVEVIEQECEDESDINPGLIIKIYHCMMNLLQDSEKRPLRCKNEETRPLRC